MPLSRSVIDCVCCLSLQAEHIVVTYMHLLHGGVWLVVGVSQHEGMFRPSLMWLM
jgi:hypothetical protein